MSVMTSGVEGLPPPQGLFSLLLRSKRAKARMFIAFARFAERNGRRSRRGMRASSYDLAPTQPFR
jgi:hypothetical protein